MKIVSTPDDARSIVRAARHQDKRIGFVPTMGALHGGHISLVRAARKRCDFVAASIFVNPTQFGPNEDFSKYPRTFDADRAKLEAEGVDLLFAPAAEEMYPPGAVTFVTSEQISDRLDGRSRPGHFRGVTTVVAKLFHVLEPDLAFFGQKDAAQVAIVKRMVRDLLFAVEIVVEPIVREPDGLALSSRNVYLSPQEHEQATALSQALLSVQSRYRAGERNAGALVQLAREILKRESGIRVDYIEVVDPQTLEPLEAPHDGALVAVAAYVGSTRLIDNIML